MNQARLDHVKLSYDDGTTWVLNDISLTIEQGERICILGPNGSGKSTLAQVLCGLEAPDEGTVELAGRLAFDGTTVDADAYRNARQATGLVFQNPEDQIVTSIVADDVAFGPENLGVTHNDIIRRVDEELARVAMSAYAQANPSRLSGGQQQRVAIASALAMHPAMLVLDEPGAMLDVRGRRGIMRVLGELQKAGTTLVHITHFMDEALEADRVIVMSQGQIVLTGTPREVFAHADTLRLLGLDVPFATQVALDLGLPSCCTCDELAHEILARLGTSAFHVDSKKGVSAQGAQEVQTAQQPQEAQDSHHESQEETSCALVSHAVAFSEVDFRYGSAPTLSHISLRVQPGELIALVGQTGSGKSTIARLTCALAQPDSGTVDVMGISTDSRSHRRKLRSHVGYVMQRPERQLFAETVYEDIAYGPRNLKLSVDEVDRRVKAELAFVGLSDKAQASPFDLSGGQQRLVALAGVLAMEPELLVLDEPIAGLDPRGIRKLRHAVQALHERDVTMILITHSMEDAAALADRMIVLEHGHIALGGSPVEIFSQHERLHELGLGLPAPLSFAKQLQQHGVELPRNILTTQDLITALTPLIHPSVTTTGSPAMPATKRDAIDASTSAVSTSVRKEASPC